MVSSKRDVPQAEIEGNRRLEVWEADGVHYWNAVDSVTGQEIAEGQSNDHNGALADASGFAETHRIVWRGIGRP
jgi:hypothetical protein